MVDVSSIGAVPGVLAGIATILFITGTSLNIESFMGSIMCLGVSVSNSVMLATFMDEHWKGGSRSPEAAILPYPESTFAPFTTRLGTAGSTAGVGPPVPPGPPLSPSPTTPPASPSTSTSEGQASGIEAGPVVSADGVKSLKITRVLPGSPAGLAGLRAGDEIRSANDSLTETPANLTWIIANAAPGAVVRMSVRFASDGKVRTLNVRLR